MGAETRMPIRRLLYRYKDDCCAHCGVAIDEMVSKYGTFRRVFQFNHIDPSEKAKDYDNLIQRRLSSEQLDEVDKCVLLCVQCHSVLHAQNLNIEGVVTLRTDGFEVEHTLKFQVIHDLEEKRRMLFSDDLEFLELYRVKLGEREPRIYSGLQLRDSESLDQMISQTQTEGTLLVESLEGYLMLRVTKIDDESYEVIPNPNFPPFKADLHLSTADRRSSNDCDFYFRKGTMIVNMPGLEILRKCLGDVELKMKCKYM